MEMPLSTNVIPMIRMRERSEKVTKAKVKYSGFKQYNFSDYCKVVEEPIIITKAKTPIWSYLYSIGGVIAFVLAYI